VPLWFYFTVLETLADKRIVIDGNFDQSRSVASDAAIDVGRSSNR
jgi:hypothetical protein